MRYEKEFNNLVEFIKLAEVDPQPTQADLSLKYIMKLGPQYNSLKVYLENELSFGRDSYPKTLADAHRITQNYKVVATPPGTMPFMPVEPQPSGDHDIEEPMYVTVPNPKFKAGSIAGDIPKHSSVTWADGGGAGKEETRQTLTIPSFLKGKQVRTLDESDKRRCLESDCKAEGHLVKVDSDHLSVFETVRRFRYPVE